MCLTLSLWERFLTNHYYSLLQGSPWNFWATWCWQFHRRVLPTRVVACTYECNILVWKEGDDVEYDARLHCFILQGEFCYSDLSTFCFTTLNSCRVISSQKTIQLPFSSPLWSHSEHLYFLQSWITSGNFVMVCDTMFSGEHLQQGIDPLEKWYKFTH